MIEAYAARSILGRAQKAKRLKIIAHQLRDWAVDKHRRVDDRPFGGGPGMVMQIQPFFNALKKIGANKQTTSSARLKKTRVILMSAKGKQFTQKEAKRLAKYDRLVFLCGRYEGVDERIAKKLAHEEMSIGSYVLTGGELPALVIADAVARLYPGVLGKAESLEEESWSEEGVTEYPQYTRPEVFNGWKVPKVLLSGDHQKIKKWRQELRTKHVS